MTRRRSRRNVIARTMLAPTWRSEFALRLSLRDALDAADVIVAADDGWHRAELVDRLAAGRVQAKSRGGWQAGTPPYGYRSRGGRLEGVPAELAVAAWMVEQRARGFAWRVIVDGLNRSGAPSPRGGRWTVETVRRIVARGGVYVPPPVADGEGGGEVNL